MRFNDLNKWTFLLFLIATSCGERKGAFNENFQTSQSTRSSADGKTEPAKSKTPTVADLPSDSLKSPAGSSSISADSVAMKPQLSTATEKFSCADSKSIAVNAGQSVTLTWKGVERLQKVSVPATTASGQDMGGVKLLPEEKLSAVYKAPSQITSNRDVAILAEASIDETNVVQAACIVSIIGSEELGLKDTGNIIGIKGKVYKVSPSIKLLPDFATMDKIEDIIVANFDVPLRAWTTGFPGVRDLFEYFGIRFTGSIHVIEDTKCQFQLTADDGANLWLGQHKVVDNDGVHSVRSVVGSADLKAGKNEFQLDYFQGPRIHIALQLLWKCGGASSFTIVPPEAFSGK